MRIEDKHTDVLQNIEFAVVRLYREQPELSDYDVMRIYEGLIDDYSGERIGRAARKRASWSDLDCKLYAGVREMCEWRLGRKDIGEFGPAGSLKGLEPVPIETLILCLKRLIKSVRTWNKQCGRQGYLEYISQFM